MKYFSTFTGIGGFEFAMPEDWECVGYSEIDPYAIKCYEQHFPFHKNYGDITKIDIESLPDFDLLVGGSPCQDLSIAKKNREGLKGERSKLFFRWLEILKVKKPRYFILENVNSMSKENKALITKYISEARGDFRDYTPTMIDAALVSAQSRKRLFWTNFPLCKPEDRSIFLKDVLEQEVDEKYFIRAKEVLEKLTYMKGKKKKEDGFQEGAIRFPQTEGEKAFPLLTGEASISRTSNYVAQAQRVYDAEREKGICLSSQGGGLGAKTGLYKIGCIDNQDSQGKRVYDVEGKSQCPGAGVSAGGESGRRTGLYIMPDKSYPIDANYHKGTDEENYFLRHKRQIISGCAMRTRMYRGQDTQIEIREDDKANSLTSLPKDSMVKSNTITEAIGRQGSSSEHFASIGKINQSGFGIRRLTPIECERLQCFPDGWTAMLSDSRRYKALGNAVNVEVVKHIVQCLMKEVSR